MFKSELTLRTCIHSTGDCPRGGMVLVCPKALVQNRARSVASTTPLGCGNWPPPLGMCTKYIHRKSEYASDYKRGLIKASFIEVGAGFGSRPVLSLLFRLFSLFSCFSVRFSQMWKPLSSRGNWSETGLAKIIVWAFRFVKSIFWWGFLFLQLKLVCYNILKQSRPLRE